ncbi:MAG: four helix bundle protein [Magnetococcales bacterium]|nr:four helix bundle protein [Magnetococcales bacterium]
MARYEHLPIYKAAFDLAVHMEKIVRGFSRYHKYSLGNVLRDRSRGVLERIVEANNAVELSQRGDLLMKLRGDLEHLKVTARLCHESGGFSSTRSCLYVAERIVDIAKQNEGWLRLSKGGEKSGSKSDSVRRVRRTPKERETGHDQNQEN